MRITCPKCSSSEARSLSLIHREGLTNTQGQTAGTSVGSLGGSLGVSTMRGTITAQSQTVLSKEAAPPEARAFFPWVLSAIVLGLFVLAQLGDIGFWTVVAALLAVLSVLQAKRARAFNTQELPGLKARWDQSFMCNRCGQVFVGS